jgi:hypothetical protein
VREYPKSKAKIIRKFCKWLKTKPGKEAYIYDSTCYCVFAQFLKERKYSPHPVVGMREWHDLDNWSRMYAIPSVIANAAQRSRTFGEVRAYIKEFA